MNEFTPDQTANQSQPAMGQNLNQTPNQISPDPANGVTLAQPNDLSSVTPSVAPSTPNAQAEGATTPDPIFRPIQQQESLAVNNVNGAVAGQASPSPAPAIDPMSVIAQEIVPESQPNLNNSSNNQLIPDGQLLDQKSVMPEIDQQGSNMEPAKPKNKKVFWIIGGIVALLIIIIVFYLLGFSVTL